MKKLLKPFIGTPWYDKLIAGILYTIITIILLFILTFISFMFYQNPSHFLFFLICFGIAWLGGYIIVKYDL